MLIEQQQEGSKGSFFVEQDRTKLAQMTYSMTDEGLMIINHTEVGDELRGKNVGYQLVNAAVEYVRSTQGKILPICPFAASVFKKKSAEFADVLKTN